MIKAKVEYEQLLHALKFLGNDLLPKTIGQTLNESAQAVQNTARKNAKRQLTIRRQYSINAIRQDRHARGTNAEKMFARVQIVRAPYMVSQEFGDTDKGNPNFKSQVPVASNIAKGGNKLNEIQKEFSLRRLKMGNDENNIGAKYPGKGFKRFFIGKPKGSKNRPEGIYFRHDSNKRLSLIRTLRNSVKNKTQAFFGKAVEQFATDQALVARFSKNAQSVIKKWAKIT